MENKKNNQVMQCIVGGLIGIICAIITIAITNPNFFSGFDKTSNVTAKSDFYEYVNKDIIENVTLDEDKQYWSQFSTLTQEKVDSNVENIIGDLIEKGENEKITQLYNSTISSEQIEDISSIKTYIDKINNSKTVDEYLSNIFATNHDLSMSILIDLEIEQDYLDNTKNIVNIYPFIFDFGVNVSDYYTNPLYFSYISNFINYDRKYFEYLGDSQEQAKEKVRNLSKLYNTIAKNSLKMEDLVDVTSYYNIVSKQELEQIYNNLDILSYIKSYGVDENIQISIVDINQAKTLNALICEDNLEVLKLYAILQILQTYGPYGSTTLRDYNLELNSILLGTSISNDTIEDIANDLVKAYFQSDIVKIYYQKYIDESSKSDLEQMINDIILNYENMLQENTWLQDITKQNAIKKLNNIKVNICNIENLPEYSINFELTNNLLENIISMNKTATLYEINSNLNGIYYEMDQLVVNASYDLKDNSINFPMALLEYDICQEQSSYYEKLGSVGMVIAHEITHAFDNNGALFDEKGNLSNWWTNEDKQAFEKLKDEVITYYSKYKLNGKSINANQTVSENIADLGALSCITSLAKLQGATNEQLQELYIAYAKLWASKSTDEFEKMLLISDTHSPDKIRVNAVLSSIDEFYDVFDIRENDGMFVKKDNRVKVW